MDQIAQLEISEDIWIHPESVKILQQNLGLGGSQDVIERAVFEISERLTILERALEILDYDLIRKIAKGLIGISSQIGLALFSKIASDVVTCIDRNDRVAITAVTRRLLRISDASLYAAIGTADPYS